MLAARALPVVLLALVVTGCSGANPSNPTNPSNPGANPDVVPSCLPPGYRPRAVTGGPTRTDTDVRGEELDVLLAVVEGEVITRRRLAREVGGLAPGQDPVALEAQIQRRLRERARLLVFVKEAQRSGITIRDQLLDDVVEEQLRSVTKEASETTGEPVSVQTYLAERGLTMDEFRDRAREELLYQAYVVRLKQGLGGPTRPQVDMEVSPAEVRRIYRQHPRAFDEKPAVRFAAFQIAVERYLSDDVGFLDAEEKATADAEALAQAFRQGADPEALARRYDLGPGEWRASKDEEFAEEGGQIRMLGEEANAWLFASERKGRDATVLSEVQGPAILGVLEVRPGRRIPYQEAYDKVVRLVRVIRERRIVEQRLIEILSSRNVVQPQSLASELVADARKTLAEIDRDPVLASARFR